MPASKHRLDAAAGLAVAATAWPLAICALAEANAGPIERAMGSAWCGGPPQALSLLGHDPACWAGSATFLLAGVMALVIRQSPHALSPARSG